LLLFGDPTVKGVWIGRIVFAVSLLLMTAGLVPALLVAASQAGPGSSNSA
jgi:hypothetical protein